MRSSALKVHDGVYYFMSENVFWIWNGWGILFTCLITLLWIYASARHYRGNDINANVLAMLCLSLAVTVMFLSGWIAGILSIPIGFALFFLLAVVADKLRGV